jgi:hypothetical protein
MKTNKLVNIFALVLVEKIQPSVLFRQPVPNKTIWHSKKDSQFPRKDNLRPHEDNLLPDNIIPLTAKDNLLLNNDNLLFGKNNLLL